jgi:uncharacterized membrane protein
VKSGGLMDVGGWEAFLHGVFAIAITLLVLDIRVPPVESTPTAQALIDALLAETPRYIAFVLGFMYLGTYWIATHRTLRRLRGVDHWFLVMGLVFLMVVSVLPFGTALLAEYIGKDQGRDQVALVLFTMWQLLLSIIANVTLQYASWHERLLRPGEAGPELQRWKLIAAVGPVIWVVALASAIFLTGTITLILMGVILVIFIQEVPSVNDERPGKHHGGEHRAAEQ